MMSALYDELTLEIERADVLASYLGERLADRSDELHLYAYSLIADKIRHHHTLIIEKATALLESARAREPEAT